MSLPPPAPPAYNHTRGDSPLTPCPECAPPTTSPHVAAALASLEREHAALTTYLHSKAEARDWHGVSDAANDLRDVEARMHAIRWTLKAGV